MLAREGNGSLAVDQSRDVGAGFRHQRRDLSCRWHFRRPPCRIVQRKPPPGCPGGGVLVEAAGQLFHLFRGGLDYAFIPMPGCGACYPPVADPSACSARFRGQQVYESLQGRPEVGPLPTPRRCHTEWLRFRRCEPRFHSALTGRGDPFVDRTRVRKSSACRSTCLAQSIVFSRPSPEGQGDQTASP